MYVATFPGAESGVHLLGVARVDGADPAKVDAGLVAGVAEHGQWLAAVIDEHLGTLQPLPGEIRVGLARADEEAVLLVDLGEVRRGRGLALG